VARGHDADHGSCGEGELIETRLSGAYRGVTSHPSFMISTWTGPAPGCLGPMFSPPLAGAGMPREAPLPAFGGCRDASGGPSPRLWAASGAPRPRGPRAFVEGRDAPGGSPGRLGRHPLTPRPRLRCASGPPWTALGGLRESFGARRDGSALAALGRRRRGSSDGLGPIGAVGGRDVGRATLGGGDEGRIVLYFLRALVPVRRR